MIQKCNKYQSHLYILNLGSVDFVGLCPSCRR